MATPTNTETPEEIIQKNTLDSIKDFISGEKGEEHTKQLLAEIEKADGRNRELLLLDTIQKDITSNVGRFFTENVSQEDKYLYIIYAALVMERDSGLDRLNDFSTNLNGINLETLFTKMQKELKHFTFEKAKKNGENTKLDIKRTKTNKEFSEILGVNVDNLKTRESIKLFFEKAKAGDFIKVVDFLSKDELDRERFINRDLLEEYIEGTFKTKIDIRYQKGNFHFKIKQNITVGEKQAFVFYGMLFSRKLNSNQTGLLEADYLRPFFSKKESQSQLGSSFNADELKILTSLSIIKEIRKDFEKKAKASIARSKASKKKKVQLKNRIDNAMSNAAEKEKDNTRLNTIKFEVLDSVIKNGQIGEKGNVAIVKKVLEDKIDYQKGEIDIRKLSYGDVAILKQENFFLGSLFLINKFNGGKKVTREDIAQKGGEFIVDLGGIKGLESTIGAGDLLMPYSPESGKEYVSKVFMNNQKGLFRSSPRVGYYNETTGRYISIYSNFSIKILKTSTRKDSQSIKDSFDKKSHVYRRIDFREYLKNQLFIHGNDEHFVLRPMTESRLDKYIFDSELSAIGKDNFVTNVDFITITNRKAFEREYLNLYPKGKGGDGGFKSIKDSDADKKFRKDSYWCSYIARANAEKFGIHLPFTPSAKKAQKLYSTGIESYKGVLLVRDGPNAIEKGLPKGSDFMDIFFSSPTKMGKEHGHRAIGYKFGGKLFALDPYYKAKNGDHIDPIPMEEYLFYRRKKGYKVERVAFYDSPNISADQAKNGEQIVENLAPEKLNNKEVYNKVYTYLKGNHQIGHKGSAFKHLRNNPHIIDKVIEEAKSQGVDLSLVLAIITRESGFNINAHSRVGAHGLMQLMKPTAKDMRVNRYNINGNIKGGTKYISKMLKGQKGNVRLATAAYNAGPGNVAKYGGVPPFKETRDYVVAVRKHMNAYKSRGIS